MQFTRSERKQLRELAERAYEAEADHLLHELDAQFVQWRQGDLPGSELLRVIHEFHQHPSRELWSMYQGLPEGAIVERGIALGLIERAAVAPDLLAKLSPEDFAQAKRLSGGSL